MSKQINVCMLLLLMVVSIHMTAFQAQAESTNAYKVSNIKARLFYHENEKFSDFDVINDKDISLFNTIIGEGSAGMPSSITLVLVEVSGPNFHSAPGKLSVTATAGKKTLAKQTVELKELFSGNGNSVQVPIVVYGTGCDTVKITATIQGVTKGAKPNTMLKEIPFGCGE